MSRALLKQVILTLAYSAQFQFPLTAREVWLRLLFLHPRQKNRFSVNEVVDAIETLVSVGLLEQRGAYVQLAGKKTINRLERQTTSRQKLAEAEQFVQIAKKIPWISGILVTGSVAVENAREPDDIDFLLITQPNRLWITRICVTVIALLAGKRRSWQEHEERSWCFNLWLEEDALAMPKKLQTLYGAYELCQAKWIVHTGNVQVKYYTENAWAATFIPFYYTKNATELKTVAPTRSWGFGVTFCNEVCYLFQRVYMLQHQTRERVGRKWAFFHPRDTQKHIQRGWYQVLREWYDHRLHQT